MIAGDRKLWSDAWESLRSRPVRTLLSVGAVSLGVGALAVLVALLAGLQDRARALVGELGGDVLAVVHTGGDRTEGMSSLHTEALRGALPGSLVSPIQRTSAPTLGTDMHLSVVSADEHLAEVKGWALVKGRFLDAGDMARGERHAVISAHLAEAWHWDVGDHIRVGKTLFLVVGIAAIAGDTDAELGFGSHVVIVPRGVAPVWADAAHNPASRRDAVFIRAPDGRTVEWAERRARRVLSAPDLGTQDLTYITPKTVLAGVRRLQQGVALSVGSIALLSLVLGGTTLMSLLAAGVLERVPEIGLRRALGGTPRDVAALFVAEACTVTLAAGVVGVAAALLLLPALGQALPLPSRVGPWTVLLPLGFALLAGGAFSWWPARQAARIPPSEALRAG